MLYFFPTLLWYTIGWRAFPHLFSVYINGVVDRVKDCRVGCCPIQHCALCRRHFDVGALSYGFTAACISL